MEPEKYREYLQSEQWKRIAEQRMRIDGYVCQCCGCRGTQANPLEVHHLSYRHIGDEAGRVYEDLVTLCRACHKGLHNTMNRVTDRNGRRGWKDSGNVPQVHVFTVGGTDRGCVM